MKLLFISILFLTQLSSVQTSNDAKKLLDEVSAKAKTYKNIEIEFKYALQNTKEKINQESKGKVIMEGNKYYLEFMGVTQLYDGKKTYTINPEDEEVTISNQKEDDPNIINPNNILDFFKKGFQYKMDIQQNVKGRTIQYVKLTPISSKDPRKEILMGIDTRTKQVYNLIEIDKKDTKTTLTVLSFKTDQILPKNLFVFDKNKYKNYYINQD